MNADLSDRLLNWYAQHRRQLPWRDHPDPYAVWVSEIMLQQTRVDTVIPYFDRWLQQYPTIADLAAAPLQDVLKLWEGLGYYSRARNLHRAAQQVVKDYGGQLPHQLQDLRQLAGIGRYTAAAIASICFDADEPTLDGNIRRVFSRLFNVIEPLGSSQSDRLLWQLTKTHLPKGRAGDYNQAWMDLGATICKPRQPQCQICPVRSHCQAQQLGIQSDLPVPKPRQEIPHRTAIAAIIIHAGSHTEKPGAREVLVIQRQEKGLLGGLWEFPNDYVNPNLITDFDLHSNQTDLPMFIQQILINKSGAEFKQEWKSRESDFTKFGIFNHAYTHFRITLHAYVCVLSSKEFQEQFGKHSTLKWIPFSELSNYPMGKLARQIAQKLSIGRR
jgi:A/G-specific adenine glycosylase